MTLPIEFLQRLKKIIPADYYEGCIAHFSQSDPTCLRVNTLRASVDVVVNELTSQGFTLIKNPWRIDAFSVLGEQRAQLTASSTFNEGRIAIQNFSSMVPPMILNPQPQAEVLDLAAAPGGKTALIAQMMNNTGRVAAVEVVKNRFFRMRQQLELLGVTNCEFYLKDGREVGRACPERFDGVLLDAPCSSESRFRTENPDSYAYWSERKIKEMQHKQKRLLLSGLQALKVGGTLVYSTCSFSPEENEMVIANALKKTKGSVMVEAIDVPFSNIQKGLTQWEGDVFPDEVANAVRILPTDMMEGFFVCLLRKVG